MRTRAFLKEHCVAGYFALAIAISWVGVLLAVGRHGIPATPAESDEFSGDAYMPMLVGPVVAGLLFIGLIYGKAGFRDLRSRLGRWRVPGRWWVTAALAVPVAAIGTLLPLWAVSSTLRPELLATDDNTSAFLALGVIGGLLVGLFEEIGWTGFAIPQLRQRHSVLATGLLVGIVWGFWHLLLFVWDSGDASGAFDVSLLVPAFLFCLIVLPLCRLLMVGVYDKTESMLLAVVMHASVTGIVAMILIPLDASGWPLTWWYLAFGAALSLEAVALHIIPVRRHRPRPSPLSSPARDANRPRATVEAATVPKRVGSPDSVRTATPDQRLSVQADDGAFDEAEVAGLDEPVGRYRAVRVDGTASGDLTVGDSFARRAHPGVLTGLAAAVVGVLAELAPALVTLIERSNRAADSRRAP